MEIDKANANNLIVYDISIKEMYDALNEVMEDDVDSSYEWYLCRVLRIMVNRAMTGNSVQQARATFWSFHPVEFCAPMVIGGVLDHLIDQMNENTKRTFVANKKRGGSGNGIEEWSKTKSWRQFISQFTKGETHLREVTRVRKNILEAILDKNPDAKLKHTYLNFKDLRH